MTHPALQGWSSLRLAPGFGVHATTDAPALAAEVAVKVDALWDAAIAERPRMFDGRIFVLDHLDASGGRGYWTSYRRAYAQLRDPTLFAEPLRALAVNGVLITTDDHVVIARRSAKAIYFPGAWQTPPAGSVEDRGHETALLDLAAQLAAEATEELGLAAALLDSPRPAIAMIHPHTHVVDIGLVVHVRTDAATIRATFAAHRDPEYDALETLPRSDIPTLLARDRDLLATARLLLAEAAE